MTSRACIVGAGNSAHVTAGLVAALPGWTSHVFAPWGDEAERLSAGVEQGGIEVCYGPDDDDLVVNGRPARISRDAAEVLPGCRVVILCLPALAYDACMRAAAPYVDEGAWIGTICASNGVDWCVDAAMAEAGRPADSYGVFALQNLPWACRIDSFGRTVSVLGAKPFMELTARPAGRLPEISKLLQELIRMPCPPVEGGFIGIGLSNLCQVIHPAVMYDNFHDWDGAPYGEAPLFYQGMSQAAADDMAGLSDEIFAVRADLERRYPGLELAAVHHIFDWTMRAYGKYITDDTDLRSRFASNQAYAGLTCPMLPAPGGGLVPDFNARYLSEDIPYNLVAVLGLARLCGVDTPTMTRITSWAQGVLGQEYLVGGRLEGADLAHTFAPQRFGFTSLEQIPELAALA